MAQKRLIGRPLARAAEAQLVRALMPMIRAAQASLGSVSTPGDARALGSALRREWPDAKIRKLVLAAGHATEAEGSRSWIPLERASKKDRFDAADFDGDALVDAWSREAIALITSVRDEAAEGLRKDIVAALAAGTSPEELQRKWKREGIPVGFGTLEGRVKVIAEHQLNLLNANVQRERARAFGVTEFFWRTKGDTLVRDEHEELGDRIFKYAKPPSEGLPGTPVNCRCWAESVIPASLDVGIGSVFER